jgi:hypothetical protein
VAAGLAIGSLDRPFCQGNAAFNEVLRTAALPAPAAAFTLAARQIAPPTIVPGAGELGIDEAVDRLVRDHLAALLARAGRRSAPATSRLQAAPGPWLASSRRVPAAGPSSVEPGSAAGRSWVCNRPAYRRCASALERSLMASDPELPRFARPSCHWQKAGQSRIDRPRKVDRSSAPWQHLQRKVLHFVCELGGPIATGARGYDWSSNSFVGSIDLAAWVPAFAGTTLIKLHQRL